MLTIDEKDFNQYLEIRRNLAERSVKMYLIRFRKIIEWQKTNNKQLSKESIEQFLFELKQKGLKPRSRSTYIQTLRHMDRYCKDRKLSYGFMDEIDNLKKSKSEIIILSLDEIEKLISTPLYYKNRNGQDNTNLDLVYLTFTIFLATTGCRFEEAASLLVKRLDIENGRATFVQTKNGDNRYVYLKGPIINRLEKLTKGKCENDLVFTNSKGKNLYPTDYGDNLKRRAKEAGITKRVHPHILRHSYATHYYESTHDIAMVATLIGHRDIQTTYDTYITLADETIKKASMRHPLMRPHISIDERLKEAEVIIDGLKLREDGRFKVNYTKSDGRLLIEIITTEENLDAGRAFM